MGDVYTNPPQSRNEAILEATINGTPYTDPPQSRIEDLLLQLKAVIEGGGGGGGTVVIANPTGAATAELGKLQVGTIIYSVLTDAVNTLANYYLKSETYNKTEVNNLIGAISTITFEAVNALPTTDIQTNVIYLVPSADPGTQNVKDEYINLDGTTAGWELIGSTAIDLSGYVTDDDLTAALQDYVTSSGLTTILADYATTAAMNTALADKSDLIQFPTLPTATTGNVGRIYQYTGATDGDYINGHFYKCVLDGSTYKWQETDVQSAGVTVEANPSGSASTELAKLQVGSAIYSVVTKAVNDLTNYYLKSDTYTKTEVNNLIGAISTITFEVVNALPTTDIQTNVIYLVPSSDPGTQNVKDEYINLDGTTAGWELIGSTAIDLSGYVTDTDLATALADYTTTTALSALLADKADKVSSAMNGNFAGLDSNGNLTDSGKSSSDFMPNNGVEANPTGTATGTLTKLGIGSDIYSIESGGGGANKADITAIGTNETGATASKAYAVGEHFYKNGKFCTAIAAIAQGATFTLGTNYVEGTVADFLKGYSTSEQNTGRKWIDGKDIYSRTFYVSALGNNSYTQNTLLQSSVDRIIEIKGCAKSTTSTVQIVLPYASPSGLNDYISVGFTGNQDNLWTFSKSDRSSYEAYLTVYYTKP